MPVALAVTLALLLPQPPPASGASPAPQGGGATSARPAAGFDLAAELARSVDLRTPAERRQAADALAARPGVTFAQVQAACRAFGTFAAREPGQERFDVELQVLDKLERTEVYLYTPKGYDPTRPAPLLLWGHGAGGTGAREYLGWQEVADQLSMFVLAPTEAGKQQGWDFAPRARAAQLAALRWARRLVNVDENAIFLGGVSRGGHMTWDISLRTPDRWAALLPCIGGPRMQVEQNNLRYLENIAALAIRDLQGSKDDALLLQNLHLAFARLAELKAPDAKLIEFAALGHAFELEAVDWRDYFTRRRNPVPAVVTRLAAEPGETRSAWAEILAFEASVALAPKLEVDPGAWDRLDDTGRRAFVLDKLVERSARLQAKLIQPGSIVLTARGVARCRLLLTEAMLGPGGALELQWAGKPVRRKVTAQTAVLLREFVERFDRTFLPIGEVQLP